jgi:hypothetical protein
MVTRWPQDGSLVAWKSIACGSAIGDTREAIQDSVRRIGRVQPCMWHNLPNPAAYRSRAASLIIDQSWRTEIRLVASGRDLSRLEGDSKYPRINQGWRLRPFTGAQFGPASRGAQYEAAQRG